MLNIYAIRRIAAEVEHVSADKHRSKSSVLLISVISLKRKYNRECFKMLTY